MTIHLEAPTKTADHRLAEFAAAAQDMSGLGTLEETLRSVTAHTQEAFGLTSVGVVLIAQSGKLVTAAATDRDVQRSESLQVEWSEGPSLEAVRHSRPSVVEDLRFDGRWRFWAPQAADLGFRSLLSVPLSDQQTFGALTVYSRRSYAFTSDDLDVASSFGRHVAVALAHVRERSVLRQALTSRAVVAQAEGILMGRYDISADKAFQVMERFSIQKGLGLVEVAQHMVTHRSLPGRDANLSG